MASVIKVDQLQSDTGNVTVASNLVFSGSGTLSSPTLSGTPTINGTLNLTGGQIKFPATAVPSSDANTLDDYEEGYFTAYFAGDTTGTPLYTGVAYGNNNLGALILPGYNGRYTKIGRLVSYYFYIHQGASFTYANGFSGSSAVWIAGLPFAEAGGTTAMITDTGSYPAVNFGYQTATAWSAGYAPMGIIESGTTAIRHGYMAANAYSQSTANYFLVTLAKVIGSGQYTVS